MPRDMEKKKTTQRRYYECNREQNKAGCRAYKGKMRDWLSTLKASIGCSHCAERDPICLEYHHRDPANKSYEISDILYRYGKETILAEIAKCDLLCANCHRKEERRLRNCK